jgi:hypothetical protein
VFDGCSAILIPHRQEQILPVQSALHAAGEYASFETMLLDGSESAVVFTRFLGGGDDDESRGCGLRSRHNDTGDW